MSHPVDFSFAGQPAYFRRLLPPTVPTALVDIGAGDGLIGSNSRRLMIEGWRGLLIEPDPEPFAALKANYIGIPRATCLSLVPTASSLTPLLRDSNFPPLFGALFLSAPAHAEILNDLEVHSFRPYLIVTADAGQNLEARRAKYEHLIRNGYVFCGALGRDSVWIARGVSSITGHSLSAAPLPPLRDSAQPLSVPGCSLDTPAATVTVGWGGVLPVEGWIFDSTDPNRSTDVVVELVDSETGAAARIAAVRTPRKDVAAHFKRDDLLFCGFRAEFPLGSLRPAFYGLNLALVHDSLIVARAANLSRVHVTLHAFETSARTGLAAKFLHGTGIEIGALQRALPLGQDCQVRYIDRMTASDLIAHYPELAPFPIQSPDIIDDGELLENIASTSQNFIVANHFLEHCQNPIRTLLNLARVLLPEGVLYVAVPDKRYTRDLSRPVTSFESLRQAFLTDVRDAPEVLFGEWAETWEGLANEAARARALELMEQRYSIHYNVWALADLLDFILRAKAEFHLPFELASVVSSENENILILTKTWTG